MLVARGFWRRIIRDSAPRDIYSLFDETLRGSTVGHTSILEISGDRKGRIFTGPRDVNYFRKVPKNRKRKGER